MGRTVVLLAVLCAVCVLGSEHDLPFHAVSNLVEAVARAKQRSVVGKPGSESAWLEAHTLDTLLNVTRTRAVRSSVQVNVVLIGFQGDGHRGVDVSADVLEGWLEHAMHSLPHVVLPLGEESLSTRPQPTPSSRKEFEVDLRLLLADPLVTVALENVLLQNARPDDALGTYYVDVFRVSALLHHLLHSLGLSNSSYTLFILNPKPPVTDPATMRYGYRVGLSPQELQQLRAEPTWLKKLEVLLADKKPLREGKGGKNAATRPPHLDEGPLDTAGDGHAWADWFLHHAESKTSDCLQEGRTFESLEQEAAGEEFDASPACLAHWEVGGLSLHSLTRHMVREGSPYQVRYIQDVVQGEVPSECLVDAWISKDRFAFLDVAAGPFEWGPRGSDIPGVKTNATVPRPVLVKHENRAHHPPTANQVVLSKGAPVAVAGGASSAPSAAERAGMTEFKAWKTRYQLSCLSDRDPEKDCPTILRKLKEARDRVKEEREESSLHDENPALNFWLAEVSALTAKAIRHVFVPGVPLFETPFAKSVNVLVTVIKTHSVYNPVGSAYFSMKEFVYELKRLEAPGQRITVTIKELPASAEKSLALAFHESLRSTIIPTIDPHSGEFTADRFIYVDSKALRDKLLQQVGGAPSSSSSSSGRIFVNERQVPVFIFSTDLEYPVFIDRTLQAKALGDMVLVTQSNFDTWKSRVDCSGVPVYLDLRDPVREALAATATHLAGLVPMHLSYSPSSQRLEQEWLWSVGDSPLSHTSHGRHFGALQHDMACRNYLVHGIEQSVARTNAVIDKLTAVHTTRTNFGVSLVLNFGVLQQVQRELHDLWSFALGNSSRLEWEKSLPLLQNIEQSTQRFEQVGRAMLELAQVFECSNMQRAGLSAWISTERMRSWFPLLLGVGILDLLAVVAFMLYKRAKPMKVKIN